MACYLITYDLDKPGQNYSRIIGSLEKAGAVRILLSTWLLSTAWNNGQVRDHFWQYLDANDRLFVCDVHLWAYQNIMNPEAAKRLLPP